jgi:hypothetical protein
VNEAPSETIVAALTAAGFVRAAASSSWTKPLAIALPLRVPALGGDAGAAAFEEVIVSVGADEAADGRLLGLIIGVEAPGRAFSWSARVPSAAWTTVAVPGLSLDAGVASAGLLVGTSLVRVEGGYALALDVLVGVHVIGVNLGPNSRIKLAGLGPFLIPRTGK